MLSILFPKIWIFPKMRYFYRVHLARIRSSQWESKAFTIFWFSGTKNALNKSSNPFLHNQN